MQFIYYMLLRHKITIPIFLRCTFKNVALSQFMKFAWSSHAFNIFIFCFNMSVMLFSMLFRTVLTSKIVSWRVTSLCFCIICSQTHSAQHPTLSLSQTIAICLFEEHVHNKSSYIKIIINCMLTSLLKPSLISSIVVLVSIPFRFYISSI